jgi:hypothetical protein
LAAAAVWSRCEVKGDCGQQESGEPALALAVVVEAE